MAPRDEASSQPGFQDFRAAVIDAARACTRETLRGVFAPAAASDHNTRPPSPAFWRYWTVEDERGLAGLCRVLTRAIALGAVRYGETTYCLPYVACAGGTPAALPSGEYLIGVADRVFVRAHPASDAPAVAEARFPVLVDCSRVPEACGGPEADPPPGWHRVRLGAVVGYVADEQVWDQMEPWLIVDRLPVGWRITAVQFAD